MNIVVRKGIISDVDGLNLLFQKLLEHERINYDRNIKENLNIHSYFNKKIDEDGSIIFVAELNQKIVGYIYGFIDKTNKIKVELEATINSIYVEENYRCTGIGTNLINTFINKVRQENVKYIYIDNLVANESAKKLYIKLGFDIFKENRRLEI